MYIYRLIKILPSLTYVQYYDTDWNQCHSLDLNSSENAVYQIETPPDIPADHNMLQFSLTSENPESADEIVCMHVIHMALCVCTSHNRHSLFTFPIIIRNFS